MRVRFASARWYVLLLATAPGTMAAQSTTLGDVAWTIPALRSLRNVVLGDSVLAPALSTCRTASAALQARVTARLSEAGDPAAAARHAQIPPSQWDATCLLRAVDSLPGLFSRRGSVGRIEEVVGAARSAGFSGAQRQAFANVLAKATASMPTTPSALREESRQDYLGDFVRERLADGSGPPPGMSLPDLSRPPAPLSVVTLPTNPPASLWGQTITARFLLGLDGVISAVSITPEITDSTYRVALMATFMRYRFKPAADQRGRPVGGSMTFTYEFKRPGS